ncbi:hypothetical protein D9M68_997010 [compost metagenome]
MQGVQADLLAQGHDAEPRDATLLAEGEQRLQQVKATVRLSLQRGQACGGEITQHDRIRRGEVLDGIQPVGENRRGLLNLAALE